MSVSCSPSLSRLNLDDDDDDDEKEDDDDATAQLKVF